MFGAIVSATDPVAVVALLKELGVAKEISTLIEGESLMNDGTAMVVFLVLLEFVESETTGLPPPGAWDIVKKFIWMSVFAPIVGIIVAYIMTKWLKRIHNNPVLEGNLTVCVPYILFYFCEFYQMSGILGLVSCGLYMTKEGKIKVSHEADHSVHAVWSYIGFVAETIIFGMTGLILGNIVIEKA